VTGDLVPRIDGRFVSSPLMVVAPQRTMS
jgi:hypothetical protein